MTDLNRLGAALLCCALAGCVTVEMPVNKDDAPRARPEMSAADKARASAKAHTDLGNQYLRMGRNGVALDEAQAALKADSGYALAYLLQAQAYADQEQFTLARPAFEEAARLAPTDPVIGNAYGWFLCSQGQEARGLPLLEAAARNPYYDTPARAWTNAGLCLLRKKDETGAEERLLRATQADESSPQAQFLLAGIAYRSARYARAKFWLDRVQKLPISPNVDVLWLAARTENKLGNRDAVRAYGRRLQDEFPGSNEYHNYLQGDFQ